MMKSRPYAITCHSWQPLYDAQLLWGALTLLVVLGLAVSYLWQVNRSDDLRPIAAGSSSLDCLDDAPQQGRCWALIGNDGQHLQQERAAGIQAKLFSLSWRDYAPSEGEVDRDYVARKRAELDALRGAGFGVFLSFGFHDTPPWLHANYDDTYYVNQYGERYEGDEIDSGDANLVFNHRLRGLVEGYVSEVFDTFGTDWAGVRVGGGRYGELTFPPAEYGDKTNSYWAFDSLALAQSPTPGWKPGQLSRSGKPERFLNWYLDQLVEFQNWQIGMVRQRYHRPVLVLYPSWGIRPGQIEQALVTNLDGTTSAERNGEIQRGFDFARQVAAITDPKVIVTTTWLDADASSDDAADPQRWSPVKYLASLAQVHPLRLRLYGENTGHGHRTDLELSAAQVRRYGLLGMAWFREQEMLSGDYATLDEYRDVIAADGMHARRWLPLIAMNT